MELSAFAHMARRNVKVVQPGLVYVIEWQAFAVSQSPTSPQAPAPTPTAGGHAGSASSPRFPDKELDPDDIDPEEAYSTIYVAYVLSFPHPSHINDWTGTTIGSTFRLYEI